MSSYSWPPAAGSGSVGQNVNVFDANGNPIGSTAGALNVAGAFTPAVNTNGAVINAALVATTASSAVPPANAVGFIIEAPSTNADNIRYRLGGVASTTAGMLMEPGRDSGFIPAATTISICAVASVGADAFSILWVLSS